MHLISECLFLILAIINMNKSTAGKEGDLQPECDGLTELGIRLWELENT